MALRNIIARRKLSSTTQVSQNSSQSSAPDAAGCALGGLSSVFIGACRLAMVGDRFTEADLAGANERAVLPDAGAPFVRTGAVSLNTLTACDNVAA